MADAGGREKIGEAYIDVVADVDLSAADRAKEDAKKKGEEIGKAISDGISLGQGGGLYGGGISGPGFNSPIETIKKIGEEAQNTSPKIGALASVFQNLTTTMLGSIVSMGTAIAAIKDLGSAVLGIDKHQRNVENIDPTVDSSLATSDATQIAHENSAVAGNPNINFSRDQARRSQLLKQTEELRKKQESVWYQFKNYDILGAGIGVFRSQVSSQYDVEKDNGRGIVLDNQQIAKNEAEILGGISGPGISGRIAGIRSDQRRRGTEGGITEDLLGLPPGTLQQGATLGPVNAEVFRSEERNNGDLLRQIRDLLQNPRSRTDQLLQELGVDRTVRSR